MMDPLAPGHRSCASCFYWEIDTEYCHAAMGYTDPTFECQDWRDLRDRTDPATGEAWETLEHPTIKAVET